MRCGRQMLTSMILVASILVLRIVIALLSKWGLSAFVQISRKIKEMQDSLSVLTKEDTTGQNGAEINRIRKEINILLDDEELWWQQRSRVQWLEEGDRNTKYFHHHASERRRKNTITGLWNHKDVWCESKESIIKTAIDYFEDIYTSSHPTRVEEVTDLISIKVTAEMNAALTQVFTVEDVRAALGQMHPTKAPDLDGMSALFYQKYWDIVGFDVANMVLNVLNSNASIADINNTYITLVPKVKMPNRMKDFQPIGLCNVACKLLSKVLANRLKTVLPQIISKNQSTFLSERLITNNVLVAFELMHYLEHKKSGNNGYMAVKLDMSKAYDMVEWVFIEKVMRRLGFDEKWIGWVMKCITSVSYSILINGEAHGNISPTRGFRQGDPLFPYLFILCTEAFSALLDDASNRKKLNGVSICRGCPSVTHLFFADDSLLFCKVDRGEVSLLMEILDLYKAASGQKINTEKSSVTFSHNTSLETRNDVLGILGPMQDSRRGKYLSLPSIIGKSKNQVFAEIKEKVGKKLSGWKEKMLSMGGKEILIKAVTQAIPTYTMSCFQLPKGLCEDLERMERNFWWGQKDQEAKKAMVSWGKMCKPKAQGGLGFRNLQAFNLAMLSKQAWRILMNPCSLIARIYKAKYFPYSDILGAKLGSSPSYAWRSIFNSLEVIRKGTRWRVGNGKMIHIWEDRWLPTPTTHKICSPQQDIGDFPMVSSLIDEVTRC